MSNNRDLSPSTSSSTTHVLAPGTAKMFDLDKDDIWGVVDKNPGQQC